MQGKKILLQTKVWREMSMEKNKHKNYDLQSVEVADSLV